MTLGDFWIRGCRDALDRRWMHDYNLYDEQLHPRLLASVRSHQEAHVPSRTAHAYEADEESPRGAGMGAKLVYAMKQRRAFRAAQVAVIQGALTRVAAA